jgi:secreted trypsin-like serine protease
MKKTSENIERKIQISIPQLFQENLICAGASLGRQGPCEGDSGGPLMYKDLESEKFVQIATVSSGVGECGDKEFPGIYVRLDHPSTFKFISSIIQKENQTMKGSIF